MASWLFKVGIFIAAIGVFLLSPLTDFLPVDFWNSLINFFLPNRPHVYWRIVPTQDSNVFELVLLGIGLALIIISFYLRNRRAD
jgi:hypothetical protein